MQLIAVDNLW